MARVVFTEKPGCGGNARRKALLRQSGHDLDVRDLIKTAWTGEDLRAFFGLRPVAQWFNATSPRVKSGEVRPRAVRRGLLGFDAWVMNLFIMSN